MAIRSAIMHDPKRAKGPIIIIGGDKGGVGKSFVVRTVAGLCQSWGHAVAGFDGDARNAHFERYYGSVIDVSRPYLRDETGWSAMFDGWAAAGDDTVILIDTPGGIGEVAGLQKQRILLASQALDREIIHIWVADEEEDSVRLFKAAAQLAVPTRTIFLMNGRFGSKPCDFVLWQESQTRAQSIAHGVHELLLPALPIRARTRIALAHAPFHPIPPVGFTFSEKLDLDMWWSNAQAACAPLRQMIEDVMA